jgi:ABC-type branched-subunit amino acid transport system ATPase component
MSMLRVENLTSGYGRIAVLRDVSLAIAKGEMVALVGSNGAGKTTLMRAISGVQPVTGCAIVFDGAPIHAHSPHARGSPSPTTCGSEGGRATMPRSRATSTRSTRHFRHSPRSGRSLPARSPADSSRCWRSGAP